MQGRMIIVQGTARVRPQDLERVRAMAAWYVPASRDDHGCLYFSLTQDMLDPSLLHVCERWADEESFAEHLRTEHARRLNEFMAKIQIMDVNFMSYIADGENLIMGG